MIHLYTTYEGYPFLEYSFKKSPIWQKMFISLGKVISLGMSELKHEDLGLNTPIPTKVIFVAEYLGLSVCLAIFIQFLVTLCLIGSNFDHVSSECN